MTINLFGVSISIHRTSNRQFEPLVRLPHGAEHQRESVEAPMVSDGNVLAVNCSLQKRYFSYNSRPYASIYEADDEPEALERVYAVLRDCDREHYIGLPYTLAEVKMTEQDCLDARYMLIPKERTTVLLQK